MLKKSVKTGPYGWIFFTPFKFHYCMNYCFEFSTKESYILSFEHSAKELKLLPFIYSSLYISLQVVWVTFYKLENRISLRTKLLININLVWLPSCEKHSELPGGIRVVNKAQFMPMKRCLSLKTK